MDAVAETTTSEQVAAVEAAGAEQIAAIEAAAKPPIEVSGATPTITAEAGRRYVCTAAVTKLSFTPSAEGACDVIFKSGTTPTTLDTTVLANVEWPDWFNPASLDASTTYELNILDGKYGAVGAWT